MVLSVDMMYLARFTQKVKHPWGGIKIRVCKWASPFEQFCDVVPPSGPVFADEAVHRSHLFTTCFHYVGKGKVIKILNQKCKFKIFIQTLLSGNNTTDVYTQSPYCHFGLWREISNIKQAIHQMYAGQNLLFAEVCVFVCGRTPLLGLFLLDFSFDLCIIASHHHATPNLNFFLI